MSKENQTRFVVAFALVALFSLRVQAQEPGDYVVTVGSERVRFAPRPELGYVVKLGDTRGGISTLGALLSLPAGQVKPIRGLDRKGLWVVENKPSASENEKTISTLASQGQVKYAAPLLSCQGETVAIIPEIVVSVTAETAVNQLEALCRTMNLAIKKQMEFTEVEYLLEVLGNDADAVFDAVHRFNEVEWIAWAYPNIAFQPKLCGQVIPNDQYFPKQWHLHNTGQSGGTPDADINAPEAWEITTGNPNIVVAVLDTGVDTNHPDLIDNLVPGYDFYDDDDSPDPGLDDPNDAHGTICAGLVAAQGNNGIGVTGVVWNCKIMPIRFAGWTSWVSDADIAAAIRWAANNGADVLSNSWYINSPVPVIHSAIVDVTKPGGIGRDGKGCVVLFSSGNSPGGGPVDYTAKYPEVIAVGATDLNDEVWYYSGRGSGLDIVAPSGDVDAQGNLWTTDIVGSAGLNNSTDLNLLDYTDKMGGTSGACPIAAGVAGLILSVDPNLTNAQVRYILLQSARDLGAPDWDDYYGFGRVDAYAAVSMALNLPPVLTLFVDDDAPNDPGPGDAAISDPLEDGSAEHPFDAIQEAIDAAFLGDTVVVLPGIYTGDGNRDIDFKSKAITVRSTNPDDPGAVAATVIDCNGTEADPHCGFDFHSGETSFSVLAGLTVTNGYAHRGAGIYCIDESSPTLTNCIFSRNTAFGGAGMYIADNSNPMVINCTFTGNSATFFGGGIYSSDSAPTLTNCILWGDTPEEIHVSGGTPVITYSDVQGGFDGEGNIDADPYFADPDNGDYHLKSQAGRWDPPTADWVQDDVTSPCIDAGDMASPIGYEPFPNGGVINMGAYGGTAEASKSYFGQPVCETIIAGDINGDCKVDFLDFAIMALHWMEDNNR